MNVSQALLLSFSLNLLAPVANAAGLPQIAVTDVGGHPESVLTLMSEVYVSNMGQEAGLLKDGDGYISVLDLNGNKASQDFIPANGTLNSPTAMLYYGGDFLVADIDRVVRIDFFSKEVKAVIDFSSVGAGFINDIVTVGSNRIVVSESVQKKLFVIDLLTNTFSELIVPQDVPVFAPNGLAFEFASNFDGGTLYVAENERHALGSDHGRVTALRLDRNQSVLSHKRSQLFGNFIDGIALIAPDQVMVSDWFAFGEPGRLHILTKETLAFSATHMLNPDGFADFSYQDLFSRVVSPDLVNGKIFINHFPGNYESPAAGESYKQCRANININACQSSCSDQFCLRDCLTLADFTCAEANFCRAECSADCGDQFCVRRCAQDCRAKVADARSDDGDHGQSVGHP